MTSLHVRKTDIELYLGKCEDNLSELPAECVDVVVTSPPYNIGTPYRHYVDQMETNEYLAWTEEWTQAVKRVLSPDGSFFLNIAGTCKEPWKAMDVAREVGRYFILQNTFHWIKSIAISKADCPELKNNLATGHFKPVNSDRYVHQMHEYVFHFTRSGQTSLDRLSIGVPYQDESNTKRWKHGSSMRCRGNTWYIPYKTVQGQKVHPAAFPVKLPWNCIKIHGVSRCKTVVDPMMGCGTTLVAAMLLGIPKAIGFDVDEKYLDLTRQWLVLHQQKGKENGKEESEQTGAT